MRPILLTIMFAVLFLCSQTTEAARGIITKKPVGGANGRITSQGNRGAVIQFDVVNAKRPNIPGPMGMEVNSFTGNLFSKRQDEYVRNTGFRRLPIEVTFSYNSGLSKNDWGMGKGWTSTFNMMYEVVPGYIIIRGEEGRKDSFSVSGSVYTPPVGVFNDLSEYAPGKFMLRSRSGHKMLFDDGAHKKVTSLEDPNGNTITFSNFVSNQPSLITDASGRSIRLNWSAGRLVSIVDSIASPPRTTTYQYDARGNLKRVTYPLGDIYRYQYDARSRMTGFTDELGHTVSIAYGSSGGVASITTPGDASTPPTELSFSYNPAARQTTSTMLVQGSLQSTVWTFDTQKRLVQVQGCCGLDEQYAYDSQNNVTQTTNSGGQIHTFTWNTTGDLLSATDPLGQIESWTYEPVFHQVTSYTDKRGFVTGFLVDAFSNPIEISRPLGVTETFTYDTHGQMTSSTDGRGNTTTYTYDTYGNLITVVFPIGSQSMSYDNSGNMTSFTDAEGNTTVYTYDAYDRRTSMVNALGGNNVYLYGGLENLVQEIDENGHGTSYAYDALNRLIAVTRPEGTTLVARDAYGNARTSSDFNGNLTTYNYDGRNRLTSITNPLGHSASITYDNNSNITAMTDYNGNPTSYTYDLLNRTTLSTNAFGHSVAMSYDPNDNMVSVTDENSHTTSYTYDALDRTTQVTYPIGSRSILYDNNSNTVSETDLNGHTTTYAYDALDRLITVTDPLMHSSSLIWSPRSNLLSVTDPNGLIHSATYDALHRMTSSANPMLEVSTYAYDAVGNMTSISTPYGNTISYVYDASDRLVSISDAMGPVQSYTYDANSNRVTETDALGNTTQYLYDVLDRLTTITAPLGQTAQYAYDNNSNVVSTTDGEGNTTTLAYDALNRMVSETFPGGLTTTMGLDPVGNPTSILDARGNTTAMAYDVMDRLSTITYANGSSMQYTYDLDGNRLSTLDQNGNLITYAYDAMDRLVSRTHTGGSDLYTYDNGGRMITANNAAATVSMTYDAAGRVLSEVLNGKTTATSYNVAGRTVTSTLPGGAVITNALNARLQPVTIATGGSPVNTYDYDAASRPISQTNNNGTATTYGYDDNSWTSSVSHHRGGAVYVGDNYAFDNRGFRTTVEKSHRPTNSEKYQYDATTRLTGYREGMLIGSNIPAPLTQTQFTFDPIGNRTNVTKDGVPTTYVANTINAYTSITGTVPLSPTYDANGNMTSDGVRAFTYDHMDRLTGVFDVATSAAYSYDALGRRVQKVVNGATTKYLYDGSEVVEHRDAADLVTATFIVGNDAPEVAMIDPGSGLPPQPYYYHYNTLGSLVALTDDSARVVERYEYDAFGNPSIFDSAYTPIPASAHNVNPLYGGETFDMESALYQTGARHYNPQLGRFMQQDPSSLMGNTPDLRNGYSYMGNNPTNHANLGSGTPRKLVNSSFVVKDHSRAIADPGVHLYAKPPIRRLKIRSADPMFRKGWDGTIKGRLSTNLTIERQTPKRDFGDRMKAGLETAGGVLANGFKTRCQGCNDPWRGDISAAFGVTGQPSPVGESTNGTYSFSVTGQPTPVGEASNSTYGVRPPRIPMGGYDGEGSGDARKGANESAAIATLRTLSMSGPSTKIDAWASIVESVVPRTNVPIKEFVTLIALGVAPPKREYVVQHAESDWDFVNRVWPQPGYWNPTPTPLGSQNVHWQLEVRALRIEMK